MFPYKDPYYDGDYLWEFEDLPWGTLYNTQTTPRAEVAEATVTAMVRAGMRLVRSCTEWDDYADDLFEVLALQDWDPRRSVKAWGMAQRGSGVPRPLCPWCHDHHQKRYLCDPALERLRAQIHA